MLEGTDAKPFSADEGQEFYVCLHEVDRKRQVTQRASSREEVGLCPGSPASALAWSLIAASGLFRRRCRWVFYENINDMVMEPLAPLDQAGSQIGKGRCRELFTL